MLFQDAQRKVNSCVSMHHNVRADEPLACCSPSCFDHVSFSFAVFCLEVIFCLPFFSLLLSTAIALTALNWSVSVPVLLHDRNVLLQVLHHRRFLSSIEEMLGVVCVVVFVAGEEGQVINVQCLVACATQSQCSASKHSIEFRITNSDNCFCRSWLLE